jgi:hypothetical protein
LELLLLVVFFSVVANAIYFLFRRYRGVSAALVSNISSAKPDDLSSS